MNDKILVILPREPYPPLGGDRYLFYNFLKILSKHFEVTPAIITDKYLEECENWLKENFSNYIYFLQPSYKKYLNTFKYIFKSEPLQVGYFYNSEFERKLFEIVEKENIKLVISFLPRTAIYALKLKSKYNVKFIYYPVDLISFNYLLRARKSPKTSIWKYISYIEVPKLFEFDINIARLADFTILTNPFEALFMKRFTKNVTYLINGIKEELLKYPIEKNPEPYFVFFGRLDYLPNVLAVKLLIENVFKELSEVEFIVLGACPHKSLYKYNKLKNVKIIDTSKDWEVKPFKIIQKAMGAIIYLEIFTGIQNKFLDMLTLGKVTIANPEVASPFLKIKANKHYIPAHSFKEIKEKIIEISQNYEKYLNMALQARELVKKYYTWKKYEKKVLKIINYMLKNSL